MGAQGAAVVLSLASALLYALTSVLQHSAAVTIRPDRSLRPGLLLDLVRRPRWLLGNLAEVGAVGLQFVALRHGSLLLVQTVLVAGLLFAVPLGAAVLGRRLRRMDWLGTVLSVAGLGVFVAVARPSTGAGEASAVAWAVALGLGGAAVALLVGHAPKKPGPGRATSLGAACGVLFGLDAALIKASGHLLDRGLGRALTSWEPYVLTGLAAYGFLLAQSAFHAGPLAASLPVLTVADPLVAAGIGGMAFHERVSSSPTAIAVELAAVVAMIVGVFILARSPMVTLDATPGVSS
jgi:drug/metabolite transporter (DMT)-like permease